MNYQCNHCQRCFAQNKVANAHTEFQNQGNLVTFSSIDDHYGINFCQVCRVPTKVAGLLHKIQHSAISLPNESFNYQVTN